MTNERNAPSLTETEALAAARAVTTLFQKWELTDAEALDLLSGMTAETWSAWKAGRFGPVSTELGARLSHLIGVHKALRLIFSGDQARVYGWVSRDNAAFGGLPALVVMREEGASGLLHVRLHLENQLSSPDEGRLTTRDRAFREGVRRLERRVSVADLLTDVQRERIARDDPFEVADPAHPAMKRNERSLTTPAFPGTGPCPG